MQVNAIRAEDVSEVMPIGCSFTVSFDSSYADRVAMSNTTKKAGRQEQPFAVLAPLARPFSDKLCSVRTTAYFPDISIATVSNSSG
jgi:hypothetical protein